MGWEPSRKNMALLWGNAAVRVFQEPTWNPLWEISGGSRRGPKGKNWIPASVSVCVCVNECKEVHFCSCNLGKTVRKHYFLDWSHGHWTRQSINMGLRKQIESTLGKYLDILLFCSHVSFVGVFYSLSGSTGHYLAIVASVWIFLMPELQSWAAPQIKFPKLTRTLPTNQAT